MGNGKIAVLAREEYRNTGIETFEKNVVPWLLDQSDVFEPVYFEPRDSFPLSITFDKLTAARRLKKKLAGYEMAFIFSQDRVVFDPSTIDATVIPYIHDIIPVTTCYKRHDRSTILSRFTDYPSTVMATRYVKFIANCDYALTASNHVRRELLDRTAFDGQAETVYQGVDDKTTGFEVSGDRSYDLAYIGSAIDRKRPDIIKSVFDDLADRGYRTAYINHEHTEIADHATDTFIDVLDDTVSAVLGNSNYYLHPSMAEGFGRGPVEAQSQGCIPIARPTRFNNEILGGDDKTVYLDTFTPRKIRNVLDITPSEKDREQARDNAARYRWEETREQIKHWLETWAAQELI